MIKNFKFQNIRGGGSRFVGQFRRVATGDGLKIEHKFVTRIEKGKLTVGKKPESIKCVVYS